MSKKKEQLKREIQQKIRCLEQNHKQKPTREMKDRLDAQMAKFKLIEASQVAKQIMYSKQRTFEYRDKPNTLLARMLTTKQESFRLPLSMTTYKGIQVDSVPDKLQVFVEYYQQLYQSSGPEMEKIKDFVSRVPIQVFQEGDRQRLNQPISVQEEDWAINNLKVRKAPGLDSLMAELYKKN